MKVSVVEVVEIAVVLRNGTRKQTKDMEVKMPMGSVYLDEGAGDRSQAPGSLHFEPSAGSMGLIWKQRDVASTNSLSMIVVW